MSEETINEKDVFEFNDESKQLLKNYFSHIKPKTSLETKIFNSLSLTKNSKSYKPALTIAASIIFLIGLGLFLPFKNSKLPSIAQLYATDQLDIETNDIDLISKQFNLNLSKNNLTQFKNANFSLVGANKKEVKNEAIVQLIFKNPQGEKISVCFLPANYKIKKDTTHNLQVIGVPVNDKWILSRGDQIIDTVTFPEVGDIAVFITDKNGTVFDCGKNKNCNFAFWNDAGKIILVASNNLSDQEIISFAIPIREKT